MWKVNISLVFAILLVTGIGVVFAESWLVVDDVTSTQTVFPILVETTTGTDLFWIATDGEIYTTEDVIFRSGTSFQGTLAHSISGARIWTFPDATGIVVLNDNTATLTNKDISSTTNTYGNLEQMGNVTSIGCASGQFLLVSGTSWVCGTAGSQTPWTSEIDADGNNLIDLGDVKINAPNKLYLDGGSDTYITEISANNVTLTVGSIEAMSWNTTDVTINQNLTMSASHIKYHTVSGITASTTQTQGNGALTGAFNQVLTVANTDDTVTLPTAITGMQITIINDGAKTLQIFPAGGNDLGNGVNGRTELETNESVTFFAYNTTSWDVTAETEIFHAEIHDTSNTDAFVINDAGGDEHVYHTNGLASGDLAGWTFDAGGAGTSFPIVTIANAGGGDITVETTGSHGLAVNDIVSQTNLSDSAYVGVFKVLTIVNATAYTVTASFTATGTGTMDQASTLNVNDIATGVYFITWTASGTSATNNETFDFVMHKNGEDITGSDTRRKFGTGGDFGSFGGQAIFEVVSGDKLSFSISNQDSGGDITMRNFNIIVIKL